jgi:hypothetical protein
MRERDDLFRRVRLSGMSAWVRESSRWWSELPLALLDSGWFSFTPVLGRRIRQEMDGLPMHKSQDVPSTGKTNTEYAL